MKIRNSAAAVLALTLIVAFAEPVPAQTQLSGIVVDPNGAPVANATIYLTNVTTNSQVEMTTPATGRFEFAGFPPGEYRVTSDSAGLSPFTVTLADREPVVRDMKQAFGPFRTSWQIVWNPPAAAEKSVGAVRPPDYRCSEPPLPPFCGPESLMQEFEQAEAGRLKAPWLAPRMIRRPDESYPTLLLAARLEGEVTMETRITAEGTLMGLRVVSADHPALVDEALALVKRATSEPARIKGVPLEAPMTIVVRYRLTRP